MIISLCGFMGCGKSTVGKLLSEQTGLTFIDSDEYIEKKTNMKITDIFRNYGEEKFREIETEAIKELCNKENIILSLGGGVLKRDENTDILRQKSTVVFIDTPFETLCQRLKADGDTRPLIIGKSDEEIKELYISRLPMYKSESHISVSGKTSEEVSEKIVDKLF